MDFPKLSFIGISIDMAPLEHGIYILYDNDELIYIGRAIGEGVTIRSRLKDHYSGKAGDCTKLATHFSYKMCSNPGNEETAMLETYKLMYDSLPRCNDRI